MRVDWVGVRVNRGMYDVRVCVAAKVRMILYRYHYYTVIEVGDEGSIDSM